MLMNGIPEQMLPNMLTAAADILHMICALLSMSTLRDTRAASPPFSRRTAFYFRHATRRYADYATPSMPPTPMPLLRRFD